MKLVESNDPILRQPTQRVDFNALPFDPNAIAANMLETMVQERGIGLAAPQVGIPYQIFVMGDFTRRWVVINPEIISTSDEQTVETEGCLSFPHLALKIKRPETITVRYQDTTGSIIEEELSGIWARCFQHEKNHLDGICFDAMVSKLTLDMAKRKQQKILKALAATNIRRS